MRVWSVDAGEAVRAADIVPVEGQDREGLAEGERRELQDEVAHLKVRSARNTPTRAESHRGQQDRGRKGQPNFTVRIAER